MKKSQGSCPGPLGWGWAQDFLCCPWEAQPCPGSEWGRGTRCDVSSPLPALAGLILMEPFDFVLDSSGSVFEICSSSSCGTQNSLLERVWCLSGTRLRYLLTHALSIIPVAVDFTERGFYFINSKEIKRRRKKPALISISVQRYIKLYFSLEVILPAASGADAVNPLMNWDTFWSFRLQELTAGLSSGLWWFLPVTGYCSQCTLGHNLYRGQSSLGHH